ncbi:hypothetical protein B0H19DRAFT_1225948 [Mycena capillaripes]|nr:hypothetical protein B0H19DRAFT_1225948 [Mycena capillaripes]
MAPICLPQSFFVFIMGFQGHVLHLANDINPTVLPIVGMPRSSPTTPNQQWRFVPINGPLASEGFIENGVQPGGMFLGVQTTSAPASVQATSQGESLLINFGNCVNSTAGSLLVVNETSNATLALTAWPMQSPDLPTPVPSPFDLNFNVIAELLAGDVRGVPRARKPDLELHPGVSWAKLCTWKFSLGANVQPDSSFCCSVHDSWRWEFQLRHCSIDLLEFRSK